MEVSANWMALSDSFYDKVGTAALAGGRRACGHHGTWSGLTRGQVELYSGVFAGLAPQALTVSGDPRAPWPPQLHPGQFGGPVLSLDRGTVTVLSCSGQQIASWRSASASAVMVVLLLLVVLVLVVLVLVTSSGSSGAMESC